MSKRRQDRIGKNNPWDIEVAFYTNNLGIDPDVARTCIILNWMEHGDLMPLAAAIKRGQAFDQDVLYVLAEMICEGRLTVKPDRRGPPRMPNRLARDIDANLKYGSIAKSNKSEEAFAKTAEALGVSEATVRQAVTRMRKMQKIPTEPLVVEVLSPRRTPK